MEKERCNCCGQTITDYKVTFTERNYKWLVALAYLGKTNHLNDDYFVNYKEVHELIGKTFVSSKGNPMVVSSYSIMGLYPWNFIESFDKVKHKYGRNGDWRLTSRGIQFLMGKLSVSESAYYNQDGCYREEGNVDVNSLKDVNFQELVNHFKSF